MKTVPSLVASSTVGVAAAGLALARPENSASVRPSSKKRKAGEFADAGNRGRGLSSPVSRPGTSSTMITLDNRPLQTTIDPSPGSQPMTPQTRHLNTRAETSNSGGGRRRSIVRNGEISSRYDRVGEETRRESVSSRGSWIWRLSTLPDSQTNSPRSSVGPDSPSLMFSHGSPAPIPSNLGSSPAQLPPNKLVKRTSSITAASGSVSRSGSRSQLPTLRRPATSHQRSVTLQQQFKRQSREPENECLPFPSIEAEISTTPDRFTVPNSRNTWRPFFESRPTKLTKERSSGRSSDGDIHNFYSTSRRVLPDESAKPTLVKPGIITISKTSYTAFYDEDTLPFESGLDDEGGHAQGNSAPPMEKPEEHKRARRSFSMHFSSPSSWVSRSGSLRGSKRTEGFRSGGKRYSSAPVEIMPARNTASSHGAAQNGHRAVTDPAGFRPHVQATPGVDFASSFQARSRNSSSPLPPLSRLSSFNLDLARLGLSSSSSSAARRSPNSLVVHNITTSTSAVSSPGLVSPTSPSYFGTINSKSHRTSEIADRASTLVGSDTDGKVFTFGDDDDVDFQSDTVFDSLRSGATGSLRSHSVPLDSLFDESPPSMNGSKTKRLSIHELLGNGTLQEENSKIMEEDEGMSTPVKEPRSSQDLNLQTPVRTGTSDPDVNLRSSPPSFCLATKDFSRLSLDDEEEDEDWTRDDENLEHNNQLSPPSSSLNSRRVSPSFRAALADLTHSGSVNGGSAVPTERPKSNLFDWSEPLSIEKLDYLGNSPRPKTAHVKQMADGRGSRTIGRRGPGALHIRSQSVPVVPDVAGQRGHSKLTPKFGTWGLGGKGVSEEWDGDFEFENNGNDVADEGDSRMEHSGMLVPKAIQASQENVVGHVGQIREVCLLVEDLKRLRLLAREKNLLNGPCAKLWKEAEGIIALAAADEEDTTLSPPHSPSSITPSAETPGDEYLDHGPDAEDISRPEAPFEVLDRHGRPTGYMYDGNTVRRRSVFSPDDDIFGAGAIVNSPPNSHSLQPPTNNSPRHSSMKTSAEHARTVMETMHQHRSTSDPLLYEMTTQAANKMPFDTTSLRDLVHRASVLTRTLSDLVRRADGSPSPEADPQPDSSPAFTRVFTDPMASPPKNLPRSQSNNSMLSGSIDTSPTRSLGQRMHMMTVV